MNHTIKLNGLSSLVVTHLCAGWSLDPQHVHLGSLSRLHGLEGMWVSPSSRLSLDLFLFFPVMAGAIIQSEATQSRQKGGQAPGGGRNHHGLGPSFSASVSSPINGRITAGLIALVCGLLGWASNSYLL